MVGIDSKSIVHVRSSRPIVAQATLHLEDGRTVRGFGKSWITRKRAEEKALEQARWAKENAPFSMETTRLAIGRGTGYNFVKNEIKPYQKPIEIPPYKVGLRVHHDGTSIDVSGSSFFRFQKAYGDAIMTAKSRLTTDL